MKVRYRHFDARAKGDLEAPFFVRLEVNRVHSGLFRDGDLVASGEARQCHGFQNRDDSMRMHDTLATLLPTQCLAQQKVLGFSPLIHLNEDLTIDTLQLCARAGFGNAASAIESPNHADQHYAAQLWRARGPQPVARRRRHQRRSPRPSGTTTFPTSHLARRPSFRTSDISTRFLLPVSSSTHPLRAFRAYRRSTCRAGTFAWP